MSIATAIISPTREADGDQCVAVRDIGWKGYGTLLRLRGERPRPRMVYLDGTVWLDVAVVSARAAQEAARLRFVDGDRSIDSRIPCVATGSTTFRRRAKRGGVEGDETYYLANEARIRGKDKIDLRTDPPPDLAIEAVISHDADEAVEVYRRLRVPEVWVCDESRARHPGSPADAAVRRDRRPARHSRSSRRPKSLTGYSRPQTDVRDGMDRAFRRWVGRTLKPRVRQRRPRPWRRLRRTDVRIEASERREWIANLQKWDHDHVNGQHS